MAKTQAAEEAAARTAGGPPGGGPGEEAASGPVLLTPDQVRQIGETIGGRTHWQADLARTLGCSKSQITRYLNGSRDTNTVLAADLETLILKQITELTSLLTIPGLPGAERAKAIQDDINGALLKHG